MKRDQEDTSGVRQEIADLDEESRAIEQRRRWIISHASRGMVSDDEAEHELSETQREMQTIQTRRKALSAELELTTVQDTQMGQTEALLNVLAEKAESADDQTKRDMVEALVQGIVLSPGDNGGTRIEVTYRFGQTNEHIGLSLSHQAS